ncbi:MAG: hypothetical protein A2W99_16010 [Bacteroidetes bacterium GWF2_33_16]|nr:MAG: hypothetical protein A2X00_15355 [Bacteroidetes bacterium GWE2_32_14]OFY02406.1 MAG: hypothetical protein A2W99_16010 [Bacteroidetes bacterium GWF2_33_16]
MKNFLLILLLVFSLTTVGQETKHSKTESKLENDKTEALQSDKNNALSEKEPKEDKLYQVMYEDSKSINSKLLTLLTNSLTVIIAVIIAIIGSSFFYNYRFNKKEYELLTKETTNKIEEAKSKMLEETKREIEKYTDYSKDKIDERFTQIKESNKSNIDTIKESLNTIISSFKQEFDSKQETQSKKIELVEKEISRLDKSTDENITLREKELRFSILDLQGQVYELREWFSLCLTTNVRRALLANEIHRQWQFEYILPDIVDLIDKVLKKNDSITSNNKYDIEKLMEIIPSQFESYKKKIADSYGKIRIQEVDLPKKNNPPFMTDLLFGSNN